MAISPVQQGQQATTTSSTSAAATGGEELGKDAFMKLLVAQLRAQDPLDPLDARDFVTQLSQLAGVEHLSSIGDRIQHLELATAGMANTQASALLGRTVHARGDTLSLSDTGSASVGYELSAPADEVKVIVRDAQGTAVHTETLSSEAAGAHSFEWNGTTDGGERAPSGTYTVAIEATDKNGQPVKASTEIKGIASGLEYEQGAPMLVIGDRKVKLGNVTSIEM